MATIDERAEKYVEKLEVLKQQQEYNYQKMILEQIFYSKIY